MIKYEVRDIPRLKRAFGPQLVYKAIGTSTGRVATKTRTHISKAVRQVYNVRARDIKRQVRLRRIRNGPTEGRLLDYRGPGISLSKFSARRKRVQSAKGPRTGATVRVRKGRSVLTGGFMIPSAGLNVFKRKGPGRFPLQKLVGPAVPQMVDRIFEKARVEAFVGEAMVVEFSRNMEFFQKREAGLL